METPAMPSEDTGSKSSHARLLRISNVFDPLVPGILSALGARPMKRLGREYHLVKLADESDWRNHEASCFVRWNLPVEHSWPCSPPDTPGFVEKAARALERKFAERNPRAILLGALDPGGGGRYYQKLASNLRGRALQVFPPGLPATRDPEALEPESLVLWGLVGSEGLFCGLQSPGLSNGFYPGGTRFISQSGPASISRAGAKIAEAIHQLRLHRAPPDAGAHWLELGASPGGMTSELLARGYQVTAVDRAPLDKRLTGAAGLRFVRADAGEFRPASDAAYDALLCDMNGEALDSIDCVARFTKHLRMGALVVFTLKMPGVSELEPMLTLQRNVVAAAASSGLALLARTHLSYNRHEFTLFFENRASAG